VIDLAQVQAVTVAHQLGPRDVHAARVQAPLQVHLQAQREKARDDVADARGWLLRLVKPPP
jgi:hypothetical protein